MIEPMNRKLLSLILTLTLIISLLPNYSSAAESDSTFQLVITKNSETSNELEVSVKGENITDLYAFEVNFTFDDSKLRFKTAKTAIPGFSVPAIVKQNHLQFAHTKIGNAAGEKGMVTLCTITFEIIGDGEADVKLTDLKIVDSKLAANKLTANSHISADLKFKAATFKDIIGHWAKESIEKAAKLGFVNGYEDGTFRPQGQVTRAEFAAMLVRALQLKADGSSLLSFADQERIPEWAVPYIAATVSAGIVTGYEDNTFRSERNITRSEIAVMMIRAIELHSDASTKSTFADADHIPDWAQASVAAAQQAGLISGRDNNLFAPNDLATRAEAVHLILAMLEYQ
jgi:hypothetical protein